MEYKNVPTFVKLQIDSDYNIIRLTSHLLQLSTIFYHQTGKIVNIYCIGFVSHSCILWLLQWPNISHDSFNKTIDRELFYDFYCMMWQFLCNDLHFMRNINGSKNKYFIWMSWMTISIVGEWRDLITCSVKFTSQCVRLRSLSKKVMQTTPTKPGQCFHFPNKCLIHWVLLFSWRKTKSNLQSWPVLLYVWTDLKTTISLQ